MNLPVKPPQVAESRFSQKILRYFFSFLQTDFKKQQAPRRRIQLKSDAGFRLGLPLRKYPELYAAIWTFLRNCPSLNGDDAIKPLTFKISPGQYKAPLNPTVRDLIAKHIEALEESDFVGATTATQAYARTKRPEALNEPEKFVEAVQIKFCEEVGNRLLHPLLGRLESSIQANAYSAVESIYDVESDLSDAVTRHVLENLPSALNALIVKGDEAAIKAVFTEFFSGADIRKQINTFFDDFATSDAFQELRDLHQALRSTENQSFYLYCCDIRFGTHVFPLFYIPGALAYQAEGREFLIEFDPHLLINKQAVDWILQERAAVAARTPISPIPDRILHLNGDRTFVAEMAHTLDRLVPSLEFAADIDLNNAALQQASSPTLKLSNAAYFAVFDKSDESMINDYEELLNALSTDQKGAANLFENIVNGILTENPKSYRNAVDGDWNDLDVTARLVTDSPIPLNEEQRKILSAIRKPECNYISVQGPPGTGKSHTITAIAFDGILSGQTVLVLSDKTEALDVVQDKLESVLAKVRHGDDEFPNPILRLGKTGNTYTRLMASSAKEKITRHYQAEVQHSAQLAQETSVKTAALKSDIDKTVAALSAIKIEDLDQFHGLEAELDAARPNVTTILRQGDPETAASHIQTLLTTIDAKACAAVLAKLNAKDSKPTVSSLREKLTAWICADEIAKIVGLAEPLSVFSELSRDAQALLIDFITQYENLRRPIIGWLFQGKKLRELNARVGLVLPCPDTLDLHKRLSDLKASAKALATITQWLEKKGQSGQEAFVYRLIRDKQTSTKGVNELNATLAAIVQASGNPEIATLAIKPSEFVSAEATIDFLVKCCRFLLLWRRIAIEMQALPNLDYVGQKSQIEELHTARMTQEIDRRFLDFVENKKATAKALGGVIKNKQKFPEEQFHHLSSAFPVIIAGIREFAEYFPLKEQIFDRVIIDEASQVSVAQALPALLRAKKVVVFGDAKQFSNVKAAQASNAINASHLADIQAYFSANVSTAADKLELLKHFDVKKSILEFFDLIANYNTMLRKHFRGYQELISFSSRHFYDNSLQSIKIRSKPVSEIIRFKILENVQDCAVRNTNRAEAEFIRDELRRMLGAERKLSVGVITPFREQLKLLNDLLFRDPLADQFESALKLRVMTFDTCQGEERDLIIFSMVAIPTRDVLNYIFPPKLDGVADQAEEKLKVQRLNVGFSRAKEGFLFVLSKPVEDFRGAIGRVLLHYKSILEDRSKPDVSQVDPSSPMEAKVLDWIKKTAFYQANDQAIELIPQFPIGETLRQLDPHYTHPAYRCDFLLRYSPESGPINVIIEYDGFAEHFVERQKIHNGNWDRYYRPEDVERQMIIESYGPDSPSKQRLNSRHEPVAILSKRLYTLIGEALKTNAVTAPVAQIQADAASLETKEKKRCPKCETIRDIAEFWDASLKTGRGGYGRNCIPCKQNSGRRTF